MRRHLLFLTIFVALALLAGCNREQGSTERSVTEWCTQDALSYSLRLETCNFSANSFDYSCVFVTSEGTTRASLYTDCTRAPRAGSKERP